MKRTALVAAAAAMVVIAAGVAAASIPDSTGMFTGCYKKSSGQLRLIDPGAGGSCSSSEQQLTWSQTGNGGIQGSPGPQGDQGSPGPAGPDGVSAYQIVTGQGTTSGTPDATAIVTPVCPDGTSVVGGGYEVPKSANVSVEINGASTFDNVWEVRVDGDSGVTFSAWTVCVDKEQLAG